MEAWSPKVTVVGAAPRRFRKEAIKSSLARASEWPKKSLRQGKPGGGRGGRRNRAEMMIKDWAELLPSKPKGLIPNMKPGLGEVTRYDTGTQR